MTIRETYETYDLLVQHTRGIWSGLCGCDCCDDNNLYYSDKLTYYRRKRDDSYNLARLEEIHDG